MDRDELLKKILKFLDEREVRCTYGAVAGLLGIAPIAVGRILGERRPEASWVVNNESGEPTGYLEEEKHPNLFANERIIRDPQELREEFEEFLRSRCGEAVMDAICDAVVDAVVEAVDDAVDDAVGDAIGDAVVDAVLDAIGDAIGDVVVAAIGDAVADAIGDAVDDAVADAIGDAVADAIDDAVGDAIGDPVDGAENGATKTIADGWSRWLPFPDPSKGGYLCAPFGPGVYELRNRETGELVLFGRGNNVAFRMTSLLPAPLGAGNRDNKCKRQYCHDHLANIEYRTKACLSEDQANCEERALGSDRNRYIFPT